MSGHHKSFYKKLDQPEEKVILWVAGCLFIAFIIWQIVAIGADKGLFRQEFFSSRFWDVLWETLIILWKYRLAPIFITLEILFAVIFVWALIMYWPMAPRVRLAEARPPVTTRKVRFQKDPIIAQHWGTILNRVKSGTQDAMKYAILEADTLVDHFLKKIGFTGEHMSDRLTQIVPESVRRANASLY